MDSYIFSGNLVSECKSSGWQLFPCDYFLFAQDLNFKRKQLELNANEKLI